MKYYVIKTTKYGVEYKKYKCIDGWTKDKSSCWKFSKQGADGIAKRLNEQYAIPYKVHFNILKAIECEV